MPKIPAKNSNKPQNGAKEGNPGRESKRDLLGIAVFMRFPQKSLHRWFLSKQRDLPWRIDRTPYKVWVSEMMLQQTQVSVVIPYFERWMNRYPTIQALAQAPLDEVIKTWEGLGYYSRARFLHAGARYLMETHQGIFPDKMEDMARIKGLGAYTVGAISSFAFHQKAAAVDGNVMRVLTRYFYIEEDITRPATVKQLQKLALSILPEEEHWITNEALIELGATVCMKKPKCESCPLRSSCQAYLKGAAETLPKKARKVAVTPLYRAVAVIEWNRHLLIRRGQQGEIMGDLHEFPYFEMDKEGIPSAVLSKEISSRFGFETRYQQELPQVFHAFTRYRVRLTPIRLISSELTPPELPSGYQWILINQLDQLAFSSGHRKIKQLLFT